MICKSFSSFMRLKTPIAKKTYLSFKLINLIYYSHCLFVFKDLLFITIVSDR